MEPNEPLSPDGPQSQETSPPIYRKVVKGGLWMFALRVITQMLSFGRYVILARLLHPYDFGILGIAMLTKAALSQLTGTGFQAALIQKKDNARPYLNSAWTVELLRGLLLFLIVLLAAPLAAVFFDRSPQLQPEHIPNWQTFLEKLDQPRPLTIPYLKDNLSASTRSLLADRDRSDNLPPGPELKQALTHDLNRLLADPALYPDAPAPIPEFSPRGRRLLQQYLTRNDIPRLNRLLLEETFPDQIKTVLLDRRQTALVIQAIGLTLLLTGLGNIGIIYFRRELAFHKQFLFQILGTLADISATITLALLYRSVWALVLGKLTGELVRLILSYLLHPYRPRLAWDPARIRELWKFGKWILGASILSFLLFYGDDLFVGKLLGAAALGFYQMAYNLAYLPSAEVNAIMTQITFPAYSKIQSDIDRLRKAYLKTLAFTAFLSFPIAALIFSLAREFTLIFMTEKWLPMVPAMQVLVIWGMVSSLGRSAGPLFMAHGRPNVATWIMLIKVVIMAAAIWPLTARWGIVGAALAVVISTLAVQPILLYLMIKILYFRLGNLIKATLTPFIGALVMTTVILVSKMLYKGDTNLLIFGCLALTGCLVYLAVVLLCDRFCGAHITQTLREQLKLVFRR